MKLFKHYLAVAAVAFATMAFVSCEGSKPDGPEPEDPDTPSETGSGLTKLSFIVGPNQGDKQSISITPKEKWMLQSAGTWFRVTPSSGYADETKNLTVEATRPNREVKERVAPFKIKAQSETVTMYAIQEGVPLLDVSASRILFTDESQTQDIMIKTNNTLDISTKDDWIKFSLKNSEPELLEDGVTKSKYNEAVLTITVPSDNKEYSGELTIKAGDMIQTVSVNKITGQSMFTADFTKEFFRRSILMRFTATWCGYCPGMAKNIVAVMDEYPDRLVPMSLYSEDSDGGLGYSNTTTMANRFHVGGYPTAVINTYAKVKNSSSVKRIFINLINESIEKFPSKTAIAGRMQVKNGKVVADLTLASKEAGKYKISIFLLENGIVQKQSNASSDYVHDYVVRREYTGLWGDEISMEANKSVNYSFEQAIPEKVRDNSKLAVAVFISVPNDGYKSSVSGAAYENIGYAVDNATLIYVNDVVDFKYED